MWRHEVSKLRGEEDIEYLLSKSHTFLGFLAGSFLWLTSEQGAEFWSKLSKGKYVPV
jgi:hypothetical protein